MKIKIENNFQANNLQRNTAKRRAKRSFYAGVLFQALENRLLRSTAPASVVGDTILLLQTDGTGADTPPGVSEVVTGASGLTFSASDLIDTSSTGSGSYTYSTTSTTTATMVLSATGGQTTIAFNFANGTVHITNSDGSTENDVFALGATSTNLSPSTVAGDIITLTITAASGSFASSGTLQFLPAVSGTDYTLQAVSGNVFTSTGTAVYESVGAIGGVASYNDSLAGAGTFYFAFTSATTGYIYNTDATSTNNLTDFQVATFVLADPATQATNQAYVTQIYNDILNRPPDAGGLAYWTGQLNSGAPYQSVALGLSGSLEYYNDFVSSLYHTYLNRAPDMAGLNYWANQMTLGVSGASILVGIVSSQEYYNDSATYNVPPSPTPTPDSYITALYQAFLNRAPDPSGLSNWEAVLGPAGDNRVPVASGFVYSLEYYNDIITGYYQTYLKRAPTNDELTTWTNDLLAGVSDQTIIADIVSLPEYFTVNNIT